MEFLKKNIKQILTIILLLLVVMVLKNYNDGNEAALNNSLIQEQSGTSQASDEAEAAEEHQQVKDTQESDEPEVTEEIDEAEVIEDAQETVEALGENEKDEVKIDTTDDTVDIKYEFRNDRLWEEHFEKHGAEFPYDSKEDYLIGANIMLENDNKLHKLEKEDGDDVYYLEATNEFIIVSKDGYLRTYFKPSKGKKYFDKQ